MLARGAAHLTARLQSAAHRRALRATEQLAGQLGGEVRAPFSCPLAVRHLGHWGRDGWRDAARATASPALYDLGKWHGGFALQLLRRPDIANRATLRLTAQKQRAPICWGPSCPCSSGPDRRMLSPSTLPNNIWNILVFGFAVAKAQQLVY